VGKDSVLLWSQCGPNLQSRSLKDKQGRSVSDGKASRKGQMKRGREHGEGAII
jgi:hypothetical protein